MPGDLRWPIDTPPAAVLARVQGRADELRRRRLMLAAGAPIPLVVVVAVLLAFLLRADGDSSRVRTVDRDKGKRNERVATPLPGPGRGDVPIGVVPPSGQPGSPSPSPGPSAGPGTSLPPTTRPGLPDLLPQPNQAGRIAFTRNRVIMTMRLDGSQLARLGPPGVSAGAMDWSPYGDRLVFEVDIDGAQAIAVMDADGRNYRVVMWNAVAPRWATPERISYTRQIGTSGVSHGGWQIHTSRPDGSDERLVVADGMQHDWSPDGERVVYQCHSPRDTCVANVDGSGEQELSIGGGEYPVWSPDGSWIAMIQNGRMVAFQPDGSTPRFLYVQTTGRWLSWSPDSQWLIARADRQTACLAGECDELEPGLHRFHLNGTEAEQVTANEADDHPVYEPT